MVAGAVARRALASGVALLALASLARAQDTTADGIVVLAAGDYDRAVEILKPIAEGQQEPDDVAAFFMAMLYDSGRGVPIDRFRACALYLRTWSTRKEAPADPFGRVAHEMFKPPAFFPNDNASIETCERLAATGFDEKLEPVTFQLEPGQWVDWDATGATVTYEGKATRFTNVFPPLWGAVFLPLQHTELDTGLTRSDRRHFVEAAMWQQRHPPDSGWRLEWHLFEVAGGRLIRVVVKDIATVDAPRPPTDLDLRSIVHLQVDDDSGDAQWAMASSVKPHRIDTESDRIEQRKEQARLRERDEARARALKAGGSDPLDVNRAPSLTYVAADVESCGLASIAGWSADRAEAIVLQARDVDDTASFDLSKTWPAITVSVHVYDHSIDADRFCTDVRSPAEERVWQAVAGTVSIVLQPVPSPSQQQRQATVTIAAAVFMSPAGETMTLSRPVVLAAPLDQTPPNAARAGSGPGDEDPPQFVHADAEFRRFLPVNLQNRDF
jgi:hypothetical protein